jgi:hypothetical protein
MPVFPLALGSYTSRSKTLNRSRCVNLYPVIEESMTGMANKTVSPSIDAYYNNSNRTQQRSGEGNKSPVAFFTAPGYALFASVAGPSIRGMYYASSVERAFFVVRDTLYELFSSGKTSALGTLSSYTGDIMMECNDTQLFIAVRGTTEAYYVTFSTSTLTALSNVNYPGSEFLGYQDGYLFTIWQGRLYWSGVLDVTAWDGLSILTPSFQADKLMAYCTVKEHIILLGTQTLEVYYEDGSSPFSRLPFHSLQYGTRAPKTVLMIDEQVMFLTSAKNGSRYIVSASPESNFQIARVSSRTIENRINSFNTVEDAFSISYEEEGHLFYQITFPTEDVTLVYDPSTRQWHERESPTIDGLSVGRHTANCCISAWGYNLIGDYQSGSIYYFDSSIFTENGRQLSGYIDTVTNSDSEVYKHISSLQLVVSNGKAAATGQGSDPQFMLQVCKENEAFSPEIFSSSGAAGEGSTRTQWKGLGTAVSWVFRLRYAEPIAQEVISGIVEGDIGQ